MHMRELAKSMVGFSWAVGLFGVQQMAKAMGTMQEPQEVTMAQLDEVARAAQRHLSSEYAQQFTAGDAWQRRLIDVLFDAASMRSVDPAKMASMLDPRPMMGEIDARKVMEGGIDMMSKSFDAVRSVVPGPVAPSAS
jgi:hypothetical protein